MHDSVNLASPALFAYQIRDNRRASPESSSASPSSGTGSSSTAVRANEYTVQPLHIHYRMNGPPSPTQVLTTVYLIK